MRWIAIILAMFMFGCASPQPLSSIKFVKEGSADLDYKRDSYECEKDAQRVQASPIAYTYGGLAGYLAIKEFEEKQRDLYIRCMESKSWQMVPQ